MIKAFIRVLGGSLSDGVSPRFGDGVPTFFGGSPRLGRGSSICGRGHWEGHIWGGLGGSLRVEGVRGGSPELGGVPAPPDPIRVPPPVKDKEDTQVDSEARPMKDETFGEYR